MSKFLMKDAQRRVTPDNIESLRPDEVFVFGSNLQGQSYALPTMNLSLEEIARYVEEFIWFADSHPELTFLVTRVGCGIAGFRDEQIAPLFANAFSLRNVFLPASFWKILSYKY